MNALVAFDNVLGLPGHRDNEGFRVGSFIRMYLTHHPKVFHQVKRTVTKGIQTGDGDRNVGWAVFDYDGLTGSDESVLMDGVIMIEACEQASARRHGTCVRAIIQSLKLFFCGCPWGS